MAGKEKFLKQKKLKEVISKAVQDAELKTSGEIVPVLFSSCAHYRAAHYKSAIFSSITFCILFYLIPLPWENRSSLFLSPESTFELSNFIIVQLLGLIFGYLLAFNSFVKNIFCTQDELAEEVHQRATQAFLENNLHQTRDRTGILIMISTFERRVQILADVGINEKVDQKVWDELVFDLVAEIKNDHLMEGFSKCISRCGDILSQHFPIKDDDTNELSNSLITDN